MSSIAATQDSGETELLALTLRLRVLSTLICGQAVPTPLNASNASGPFSHRYETLLSSFHATIATQASDSVKRFIDTCAFSLLASRSSIDAIGTDEQNAPLLEPSVPASSTDTHLTLVDKATLLLESENEIQDLERTLREIQHLEQQGLTEPGKLTDAEGLRDQLDTLGKSIEDLEDGFDEIEDRATKALDAYDQHVSSLHCCTV